MSAAGPSCGSRWAPPPPPGRTSSGSGHCCARATTGWAPPSPPRPRNEPPPASPTRRPQPTPSRTPSVLEPPDQALLGHGGDVGSVGGPDLPEAQRTAGRRRRTVGLVEQPVVGAYRVVEPHGVVEARSDEVRPPAPEPGENRPRT